MQFSFILGTPLYIYIYIYIYNWINKTEIEGLWSLEADISQKEKTNRKKKKEWK